jgi:hypothetical protein
MSTPTIVQLQEKTLGPLSSAERETIMLHARALTPEGRRLFRRLLILAQERGLSAEVVARAAAQAREHVAAFI